MKFYFIVFSSKKINISKWTSIAYLYTSLKKNTDYEIVVKQYLNEQIDMAIKCCANNADVIGIPLLQDNHSICMKFAERLKNINPSVKIILGNIDATIYSKYIMKNHEYIDYIIKGEGEETLCELCNMISTNLEPRDIQGILYRNKDKIIETPNRELLNIDDLSFPMRDFLKEGKTNTFAIITTRGCFGNCTFCNSNIISGKHTVRIRSVDNVIEEIRVLCIEYGCVHIDFTDSIFLGGDYRKIEEFYLKLKKMNMKITFNFNLTCDCIDVKLQQLLKKLQSIGLEFVYIGIESGNQKDLKLYGKKAKVEDNEKAVFLLKEINLYFMYGFIMFNPYSTFETIKENLRFIEKNELIIDLTILSRNMWLFGDTPIVKKIIKDGLTKQKIDEPILDCENYEYRDERIKIFHNVINYSVEYLDLYNSEDALSYYLLYDRYKRYMKKDEKSIEKDIIAYDEWVKKVHLSLFKKLLKDCETNTNIDFNELNAILDKIKLQTSSMKQQLNKKTIKLVKDLYALGKYTIN